MNRIILKIMAGILVAALISCAGAPPVQDDVEPAPEPGMAEVPEETGPIWKLAGETVGSPDGIVDKEIEYAYDGNGRLIEILEHDGRGELLYSRRFEYDNGVMVRMEMSDRFGLIAVTIFENDGSGFPVKEIKQDAQGENLSIVTYD